MKFATRALVFLLGGFVLSLSVPSVADDKKEVTKDVKFACSRHGPKVMQLILTLEKGDSRKIEINGTKDSNKLWTVLIDGKDVTPDPQTDTKPGTIKVRSGDTITWNITGGKHGVAFAEQDLAQAMLDFDLKAGKPLKDLTTILTSADWKKFGTKRWGTEETDVKGVLASCKVK